MPTPTELRTRCPVPDIKFDAEDFKAATTPFPCILSAGCSAGVVFNGVDSVLLGHNAEQKAVWASASVYSNPDFGGRTVNVISDSPGRAFLRIQVVSVKGEDVNDDIVAVVRGCASIEEVVVWHSGIQGDTLVEKYAFAHDVLLSEIALSTG